jgi:hypothetical protein
MTQVGTTSSEGVITAEWDFESLAHLWASGTTPVRQAMPMGAFASLADIYQTERTLDQTWWDLQARAEEPLPLLDVLPQEVPAELLAVEPEPVPLLVDVPQEIPPVDVLTEVDEPGAEPEIEGMDEPLEPPEAPAWPEVLPVEMLPEVAVAEPELSEEGEAEEHQITDAIVDELLAEEEEGLALADEGPGDSLIE